MRIEPILCPRCRSGRLKLHHVTYVFRAGDMIIHDSKMPAWVCDRCHARQYDARALRRVHLLAGSGAPDPMRQPLSMRRGAQSPRNSREPQPILPPFEQRPKR